jgi:hypothetical protein
MGVGSQCHALAALQPRRTWYPLYRRLAGPQSWTMALGLTQRVTEMSKSVPLQAWSDPEGSRKLRFPDFMTTAQEGGKVVSLTHQPHLPPGNSPGTHFW